MLAFISKESKIKLRVFGWYQIVGGILGVLVSFWLIARAGSVSSLIIFLILAALALYSFSIYCGILLLDKDPQKGLKLSIINQAFQIITFKAAGYGFQYVSGLMLSCGIKMESGLTLDFNFALASTWFINVSSDDVEFLLAVNIVAIYWIYFANKLIKKIRLEETISTESVHDALLENQNGTTD